MSPSLTPASFNAAGEGFPGQRGRRAPRPSAPPTRASPGLARHAARHRSRNSSLAARARRGSATAPSGAHTQARRRRRRCPVPRRTPPGRCAGPRPRPWSCGHHRGRPTSEATEPAPGAAWRSPKAQRAGGEVVRPAGPRQAQRGVHRRRARLVEVARVRCRQEEVLHRGRAGSDPDGEAPRLHAQRRRVLVVGRHGPGPAAATTAQQRADGRALEPPIGQVAAPRRNACRHDRRSTRPTGRPDNPSLGALAGRARRPVPTWRFPLGGLQAVASPRPPSPSCRPRGSRRRRPNSEPGPTRNPAASSQTTHSTAWAAARSRARAGSPHVAVGGALDAHPPRHRVPTSTGSIIVSSCRWTATASGARGVVPHAAIVVQRVDGGAPARTQDRGGTPPAHRGGSRRRRSSRTGFSQRTAASKEYRRPAAGARRRRRTRPCPGLSSGLVPPGPLRCRPASRRPPSRPCPAPPEAARNAAVATRGVEDAGPGRQIERCTQDLGGIEVRVRRRSTPRQKYG